MQEEFRPAGYHGSSLLATTNGWKANISSKSDIGDHNFQVLILITLCLSLDCCYMAPNDQILPHLTQCSTQPALWHLGALSK